MSRNEGTIEEDKEYLKFCAELEKSQETNDCDPATASATGATTTVTNATEGPPADDVVPENKVIITPLMEFIRRQRESKLKSKSKNKGKQSSVCPIRA